MQSFILIALFISGGYNAEVIRRSQVVPYVMGGSKVVFRTDGIQTKIDVPLKCVIRFSDGRDSIAVDPALPLDGQSVICQLPRGIDSGSVVVELEAKNPVTRRIVNQSTKTVLNSEAVIINSSPSSGVVVEENWDTNELYLTWDFEYFQQFFETDTIIMLLLTVDAAESFQPIFTGTLFTELIKMNSGAATIAVSKANIDIISNIHYPYVYTLRPFGAPDEYNVYLSSVTFAPTLGMSDNEASRICGMWLEIAKTPSEITPCPPCLCQIELDDNFIQSEYDPHLLQLANGTLDNHVLYYERNRTKEGHAQTCSYDTVTRNLATTSPGQASWIHTISKDVSSDGNFFADIWPFMVCCLQSNSHNLCDLFHRKRPVDTGHRYEGPESPCTGWGDPHFITFNDVKYDFMGNGEFWLIRGPAHSGFGVQGRMSPLSDTAKVSLFNAIAIRDGNTTVQLELKNYRSFHLFLNGIETPIPENRTALPLINAHIFMNETLVNIRLQSGFSVVVQNIENLYLNVFGSGAHKNKGKGFMGLFGNVGYNVQNDLTSQEGFVIPPTSENLLDLSLIHHRFGMTWMTTANESFFVYEDRKSWEDYANPDFGPILQYPDPSTMPAEVRAICGDSLFCYYEYVGTGNLERAADAGKVEQEIDQLREEIKSVKLPMCDVVLSPSNGRVQVNGYFNGSIATYTCAAEYEFESGDRTRTCYASENESHWTGIEPTCFWTCKACEQNLVLQQSVDPSDCTKFFLCFMGERLSLKCALGSAFDPATRKCEKGYVCPPDPPGC